MHLRVAVVLALLTSSVVAQEVPPIAISRATGAIAVDGDLSDSDWQGAAKVDRFFETSPGNNIPARVKTIAMFTYDDRYFYIGIRAEDPNPKTIRAPYVERDNVIGTDDNIAIFLDTRNDKRSAIELRVNPRGIQGDAIFNDANSNEDFSPDFFYDTAAKIDAGGWTAEYRIPFSTLRYPHADPQTWNVLVWRNYPREYRYAFHSAPIPRGSNCLVCFAHPIVGLTNLPDTGHLVATPYATAQRQDVLHGLEPGETGKSKADAGADIKWTPSATNAVDLTINPDFSQVESDVAQISVNRRFAVFYPEKRPFFLEGFDLFDTPMRVAYTRTINSPRWGLRSTGKVGGAAYTLLVTQDRGGGVTLLPGPLGNSFAPQDARAYSTIARVRQDLGTSFVGAVFTDRELRGGGHNRVAGPDAQWRPNDSDAVTAQALYSDTDDRSVGKSAQSHAFSADWSHVKTRYDAGVILRDVGDGFRADLGFIPQAGYREAEGVIGFRFYPESGLIRFVRPSFLYDYQVDRNGTVIYRGLSPGVTLLGAKNLQAFIRLVPKEQYRVGNDLPAQTYSDWQIQFDPSRRFTRVGITGRVGQSVDFGNGRVGHGVALGAIATVRPIDKLTFDANFNHETLDEGGVRQFTAIVERLKTTYSFSANSLVRVIGQYVKTTLPDLRAGNFSGSVLYSYRVNWQTVLYVGYGDDRVLLDRGNLEPARRSFFTKVSYAIQR